ncbi:hypothetical protein SGLAM104S_08772 [Streptomyces glaucescens]
MAGSLEGAVRGSPAATAGPSRRGNPCPVVGRFVVAGQQCRVRLCVACGTCRSGGAVAGSRGAHSSGTAPAGTPGGHDGGMAGLEGIEQPRGRGRATTGRWSPAVEDELALKALETYGNPTEQEVSLPSRPESAAAARRRRPDGGPAPVGTDPQDDRGRRPARLRTRGQRRTATGALVFHLRMRRLRGRIRVEVRDPSRGLPACCGPGTRAVSGRGQPRRQLSDRWGVDLLARRVQRRAAEGRHREDARWSDSRSCPSRAPCRRT